MSNWCAMFTEEYIHGFHSLSRPSSEKVPTRFWCGWWTMPITSFSWTWFKQHKTTFNLELATICIVALFSQTKWTKQSQYADNCIINTAEAAILTCFGARRGRWKITGCFGARKRWIRRHWKQLLLGVLFIPCSTVWCYWPGDSNSSLPTNGK